MINKILKEINRLRKELDGYSASEALDYIEAYLNAISEEPASEDLEKAANFYANTHIEWFDSECNPCVMPAFKAGAEWQKQKDLEDSIKSDMTMPNKFYEKGRFDMREEMMKNTVLETKVMMDCDGDGIETSYEEWLTLENTEIPSLPDNLGLKDGDKVKIIIIKEEQQ